MSTNSDNDRPVHVEPTDIVLDITRDVCPMTFVRTRLLLDRMSPGAVARVRLTGREPLGNVPRSARELGHAVVSLAPEAPGRESDADPWILTLRKKG